MDDTAGEMSVGPSEHSPRGHRAGARAELLGRRRRRRSRATRGLAFLAAAAVIGTAGTFASFTATTAVTQSAVSTSTLSIGVPAAGLANRLTLGALSLVPGDTLQRVVDLTNSGASDIGGLTLTSVAGTSSALDTDVTNGLQLTIDRCLQAWTESGVSPAFVYTCGGTTSSVLGARSVIGSALPLSNLTSTTAGATDHLRFTLALPLTATNLLQ